MASLTRTIRRSIETRGMNKKQKQQYRYEKRNAVKPDDNGIRANITKSTNN